MITLDLSTVYVDTGMRWLHNPSTYEAWLLKDKVSQTCHATWRLTVVDRQFISLRLNFCNVIGGFRPACLHAVVGHPMWQRALVTDLRLCKIRYWKQRGINGLAFNSIVIRSQRHFNYKACIAMQVSFTLLSFYGRIGYTSEHYTAWRHCGILIRTSTLSRLLIFMSRK